MKLLKDPVLRFIACIALLLAAVHVVWIANGGYRGTLPSAFYPVGSAVMLTATLTTTLIALTVGVFLALGRYTVLRDATSWWMGTALGFLWIAIVFRILSFPFAPGGSAILPTTPSASAWMLMSASTLLAAFLIKATLDSRKDESAKALWPSFALWAAFALICVGFLLAPGKLPILVTRDGVLTGVQIAWHYLNIILLAAGILLGIRRYLAWSDKLIAFAALAEVAFAFAHFWSACGGNRFSAMSAAGGIVMASGYLVMAIGLLSDYVSLLKQETQNSAALNRRTEEIDELNDRLHSQVKELRTSEQALQRTNRDLQQFAYVASHDLREPLRNLATHAELLVRAYKRGELEIYGDECAHIVAGSAQRMEALISGLLKYSRTATEAEALEPVDMNDVVTEALTMLQQAVREKNAQIVCDRLPEVLGASVQLTQVVQNLIENSLKYARPNTQPVVEIRAARNDQEWLFSVRDNGEGFKPQYATQIFGIFKRLHGPEVPGTGIGLAVCKAIVDRHGGRIWAESCPGSGTTVHFTLPTRERE